MGPMSPLSPVNPFFVLGVKPDCTRVEAEREGQKLLGMLELGLAEAATYRTPNGPAPRDADLVRRAIAEMADPEKRLVHEIQVRALEGTSAPPPSDAPSANDTPRWLDAFAALGFSTIARGVR